MNFENATSMESTEIERYISNLSSMDVRLWLEDGRLRCNAPDGVLTDELRDSLVLYKTDIIDFLEKSASKVASRSIPKCSMDSVVPLTYGQERLWTLSKANPGSSVYNIPTVFHVIGQVSIAAIVSALKLIQERHEILRTVFLGETIDKAHLLIKDGYSIEPEVLPVSREFGHLDKNQFIQALNRIIRGEISKPFDITNGPLWRTKILHINNKDNILIFTMHHIIFDGLSKSIFLKELSEIYTAKLSNAHMASTHLAPLNIQYADYSVWQRNRLDEAALSKQLQYWRERLSGDVPALTIPNDLPRRKSQSTASSVHFKLPNKLAKALDKIVTEEQSSHYISLLSAFYVLLNRHTSQEDLLVCSPMGSREHKDVEQLIGYFNNIVIVRADLSGNPSYKTILSNVRRLSVEAYDNQHVALQHIAAFPNLARTQFTRALFSYQETSSRRLPMPGAVSKVINVRNSEADFDIAYFMERDGDSIVGIVDYNSDLFSNKQIERLIRRYTQILAIATENPDQKLNDYPLYGRKPHNIESILSGHEKIDKAIVVPSPKNGNLNAYLVLNEYDVPNLSEIRTYVAKILPDYRVPSTFIPLDTLPLQEDGDINYAALPLPTLDRDRLNTPYVEPKTDLEKKLVNIWKKVLWLEHDIGINDDFRDLGGHSLLSVQLLEQIRIVLGIDVPLKAIANINTIRNLALAIESPGNGNDNATPNGTGLNPDVVEGLRIYTSTWEGSRISPESTIVGLNTNGKKQPIFWCLQRYHELKQLAKYLSDDQPVYGMRSGNRIMERTPDNIKSLALHYVSEIKTLQHSGPYILGGNCQAAQIIFEIACILQSSGEEITLLILMEQFIPRAFNSPIAILGGENSPYNPATGFHRPEIGWRKYYTGPLFVSTIPGQHSQYFQEPNISGLTAIIDEITMDAKSNNFDAWNYHDSDPLKIVDISSYAASITGPEQIFASINEKIIITVQIKNISPMEWLPSDESGIYLASHWLMNNGHVNNAHKGCTKIFDTIRPYECVTHNICTYAPTEEGEWVVEIDLVDEGITWFKEHGSAPCRIRCVVKAN